MAQRTTRQWIIAFFSVAISLAFLGVSFAPLISGILSPPTSSPAQPQAPALSQEERTKVEIASYEKVLAKEPTNRFALENLVNLRNQLGDIKGTIGPLQTLANAYPNQPVYRLTLARTYLQLQQEDKANTEYQNVLTTDPGNQVALQQLVSIELTKSRPDAAVEILINALDKSQEANKIKPNTVDIPTVKLLLGDLYLKLARLEEAENIYREVKNTDPQDFRPILGEAFIRREQKQEEAAQKLFAQAKKLAPEAIKSRIDEIAAPPTPTSAKPAPPESPTPPQAIPPSSN